MTSGGRIRDIVILGSTGSIGTQALDVVRRNHNRFRVAGLAADGGRPQLLAGQAIEFGVGLVGVTRATSVQDVQLALYAAAQKSGYAYGKFALPKIVAGADAAEQIARMPCDMVVNGIDGAAGLRPTLAALESGAFLALANKESLIMGGNLVLAVAKPGQIVPVASTQSALAQCLRGGRADEVSRLILTASGGPFRGRARADLAGVTPAEVLAYPNSSTRPMASTNTATLANVGLNVIEAHLLFGIDYDRIDVVVHPQSIVHSMVEFVDGSVLAHASPPERQLPIGLALAWPERLAKSAVPMPWDVAQTWEFEPVDHEVFPGLQLAIGAGRAGGLAPAIYSAANEFCVHAFHAGQLSYLGIVDTIAAVLTRSDVPSMTGDLDVDDVLAAAGWARDRAAEAVSQDL